MTRIQSLSTIHKYLSKCKADGRIIECSREVTVRIDEMIADFESGIEKTAFFVGK